MCAYEDFLSFIKSSTFVGSFTHNSETIRYRERTMGSEGGDSSLLPILLAKTIFHSVLRIDSEAFS